MALDALVEGDKKNYNDILSRIQQSAYRESLDMTGMNIQKERKKKTTKLQNVVGRASVKDGSGTRNAEGLSCWQAARRMRIHGTSTHSRFVYLMSTR